MLRVSEFVFYELAIKVHKLTEITNDLRYSQIWLTWWGAREALDEIYRQRPLNFVNPTSFRLYQAITAVVPVDWDDAIAKYSKKSEGEQHEEEPVIPFWQIGEIREAATEFETVLRTECQVMDTYFVSKKGTYSTKDLVENAHFQIPNPSRSSVPDQTKTDFDQAGRCVAFDLHTAAAFHMLRGTEATIRKYYELVVPGPKRASPRMRSWGVYIRLMKAHGAEQKIVDLLSFMKDTYRNPVLHPEANFADEDAQVLWGLCISAVVLIESDIKQRIAKGGMLSFPVASGSNP